MRKILGFISVLLMSFIVVACTKTMYTVTFDSTGGSAVASVEVEENLTVEEPADPTKTGYVFVGWFTSDSVASGDEWDFEVDLVTEDITLYARWTVAPLTDSERVDAAFSWLQLGDLTALVNSSPRLILPTVRDGVTISWVIDKLEYIAANGVITQPDFETGNQTVTLTATLTLNAATRNKVFTATVLALPSVEDTEPLIDETFELYTNGDIITQAGIWGPVSGKSGNSHFTVVDSIVDSTIPDGSKALKIEALLELQIEAAITHTYDLVIIEADLMQTVTTGTSSIHIQSSSSSPVVAFGLNGRNLYYRVDNGDMLGVQIDPNIWYTIRAEIDLANKTLQVFYYMDGQLISLSDGPVDYAGTTSLQSLFIRSGSSTNTVLLSPAYITNIIANRVEALPRPDEIAKLGEVTGITPTVSLPEGGVFTVEEPVVKNFYGNQDILVKDTDYTLVITNPVDMELPGVYDVIYTITNSTNALDIVVIHQEVTVYAVGTPNEISAGTLTEVGYLQNTTTASLTVIQPSGELFYILNSSETATKEAILLGESVDITSSTVQVEDIMVGDFTYMHFIVVLFGESNIFSVSIPREAVIEISTLEAFHTMATVETTLHYALVADLDFAAFTWTDTNASFKGVLYGNMHTIKNITINATAGYGGIFARTNNAVIRDLIVDHVVVTTAARAGILVGRVETAPAYLSNIIIMNSSVSGADSNGVGGVIGLVSKETHLNNVSIIDSTVTSVGQKNVGGVVGRVDSAPLIANDIYVRGVTVTSTVTGEAVLDVAAGAFVGYVRDNIASVVTGNRIVIIDTEIDAIVGGALIGYLRNPGSATIANAYVEVTFTNAAINAAGLIGRVNNETDKIVETTIFGSLTNALVHAQTQALTNVAIPENLAWWSTNLMVFVDHALWSLDTNNIFALDIYLQSSKPLMDVTLDYNIAIDNEIIQVRQDQVFSHDAPASAGYNFVGWFMDELLTIPMEEGYVITANVTLYGKYETVPASTVSFVTNVVGLTVDSQMVNYGMLATEPVVANQMITDVIKEVVEWTLNGVPFDFSTPVTASIELVAVWETISLDVTFNGTDTVSVTYGALVAQPVAPIHPMFVELIFDQWTVGGVIYDFNTPVTTNLNLVSTWTTPASIAISTKEQFYYMATVGSAYLYELSNSIDFTGFTWTQSGTGATFSGVLDGKGFTISNITITGTGTGVYGGIFQRTSGAVIHDLTIDNVDVNAVGRVGVLIGRIENSITTLTNVNILNSSATGTAGEGVGVVVGNATFSLTITNMQIINSTALNTGKNVALVAGRADNAVTITDLYIFGSSAESTQATTDAGIGGVIGYTNHANAAITLTRVVIEDSILKGRAAGSLVGYYRFGGLSATDVFTDIEFVYAGSDGWHGVIGRRNVDLNTSTPALINVYAHFTTQQVGTAVQLDPSYMIADLNSLNQTWWTTTLSGLTGNTLWEYDAVSKFYELA